MRIRAFKLSLTHWKLLMPAVFAFQLLFLAASWLTGLVNIPLLSTVVSIVLMVLLYPFSLAVTTICIRIWHGEAVHYRQLLTYYTNNIRLGRMFGMGVVFAILPQLFLVPFSLMPVLTSTNVGASLLFSLLSPIWLWAYMWFDLRLFASQYILVTTDGIDPIRCLPASFSFMRGRCWRLLGYNFSLGIIPALLIVIATSALLLPSATASAQLVATSLASYTFVVQLIATLATPFIGIATAGYFLDVMLTTPGKPPKNKMQVQDIYRK